MNSVFYPLSAVQGCLGGSFYDGGNRIQLLVFEKEHNRPVCETGGIDRNSMVWTPTSSLLSSNRVTVADGGPRDFGTQPAHECFKTRHSLASGGIGGWATTIKSRKDMTLTQSYRDSGFQVSGLVRECQSGSALTHSECRLTNVFCEARRFSQASWRSSILSRQHLFSLRSASGTETGSQASSKLRESLAVEFDKSRFLVSKNARAFEDNHGENFSGLGLRERKSRISFARSAILRRSPDTKPDEQRESYREAASQISVATTSEASDSVVPDGIEPVVVHGGGGKSGFVSFRRPGSDQQEPETTIVTSKSWRSIVWLLGPLVLTASVFLPPLYLRKIFGRVLNDSLMTDFVILIFTETLFFIGASVFLYIAHQFRDGYGSVSSSEQRSTMNLPCGYRVSSIVSLGVGLFLPVATFSMVWPWTGPAAAAALAPYMVGLLVQLGLEQITRVKKSPVWPLVPITFQMYRLHQLNRAAQLISGLMFSLKGVEATAETMAISGSLQILLLVLKILGVVCLGSLGAFLTHQLPTHAPDSSSIASLP